MIEVDFSVDRAEYEKCQKCIKWYLLCITFAAYPKWMI